MGLLARSFPDGVPPNFRSDIESMTGLLRREDLEELIQAVVQAATLDGANQPHLAESVREEALSKAGIGMGEFQAFERVARFYLRGLMADNWNLDAAAAANELLRHHQISENDEPIVAEYLGKLAMISKDQRLKFAENAHREFGLPTLVGVSAIVDYRVVTTTPFLTGMKQANYRPTIDSLLPLITISLRTKQFDKIEHFAFTLTRDELEQLIEMLHAPLMQMDAAEESVND